MKYLLLIVLTVLLQITGCSNRGTSSASVDQHAAPLDGQECGTCGMIVREQSAARAQLVHRDGTREFFCSIGDLLVYLQAPSPHGAVVAIYVETLDSVEDPRAYTVAPQPWVAAESAFYVTGVAKARVMGQPVLVFAIAGAAEAAAQTYGGTVVAWSQLTK